MEEASQYAVGEEEEEMRQKIYKEESKHAKNPVGTKNSSKTNLL